MIRVTIWSVDIKFSWLDGHHDKRKLRKNNIKMINCQIFKDKSRPPTLLRSLADFFHRFGHQNRIAFINENGRRVNKTKFLKLNYCVCSASALNYDYIQIKLSLNLFKFELN